MNKQQSVSCAILGTLILCEYGVCTALSLDMARLTIHSDPSQRSQLLGLPGGAFLTLSLNCAAGFELFGYLRYRAGLDTGSAAEQSLAAMATVPMITLVAGLLVAVGWNITTGSDSFWWWLYVALFGGTPLLYWRTGHKARAAHRPTATAAANSSVAATNGTAPATPFFGTWQRFSERTRRVMLVAQEEAEAMNTNAVDTAHILLALLREEDNLVAEMLGPAGLTAATLRPEIQLRTGSRWRLRLGHPQIAGTARQSLVKAARAAKQFQCEFIAPEHLLLGVAIESAGLGAELLARAGLEPLAIYSQIQAYYRRAVPPEDAAAPEEYKLLQARVAAMEARISELQAQLEQAGKPPEADNHL